MKLMQVQGRAARAAVAERRRFERLPVAVPAIISWEDQGARRQVTGSCLDFAEGGCSIRVTEPLPISTRVYLHFPDLKTEADGVVRHAGDATIGVEFSDLVYHGPHRWFRKPAPPKDPGRYVTAALGFVLLLTVAYGIPGLLPEWVPFSRRVDRPVNLVSGFFTLGSTKAEVYALQGPPTRITDSTWHYGSSRVFFRESFVVGWFVSQDQPLHTGAAQPRHTAEDQEGIAVGSTASEVLAVEGPPTELTDDVWRYGKSEVYFKNGKVVAWKAVADRPLKAKGTEPKRRTQTSAEKLHLTEELTSVSLKSTP